MNWKTIIALCAVIVVSSESVALAESSLNQPISLASDLYQVTQAVQPAGSNSLAQSSQEQTRTAQCDRLIAVANRATDAVQQLSQTPSNDSTQDLLQTATIAERASTEMQALSLSDSKLLQFRDRFVTMYSGTSRTTRDLIEAANRKDDAAVEQAFTKLQTVTAVENDLVPAINTYCGREQQK